MEKLIITLAPTGSVPNRTNCPSAPLTPPEIARDIVACYEKGIAVAHIHTRDENGKSTHELKYFQEVFRLLDEAGIPVIRQISTGGRAGMSYESRAQSLVLNPASASLTTGSTNFPDFAYTNDVHLVRGLAEIMRERNIKPELEIFDTAMIQNAVNLHKEGLLKEPLQFNLVMGIKGAIPATPKNLFHLVESLPANSVWSVSVIGPAHMQLSTIAIALGGHVRVGLEDNLYFTKGVLATNMMLVERIVAIAKACGRELATPDEARKILGLA